MKFDTTCRVRFIETDDVAEVLSSLKEDNVIKLRCGLRDFLNDTSRMKITCRVMKDVRISPEMYYLVTNDERRRILKDLALHLRGAGK